MSIAFQDPQSMTLFDNPPKIGWNSTAAKALTASRAEAYIEYLEHRIEVNDYVKGTQISLKKGRVEGIADRKYMRHDIMPIAVAVRVDRTRSYVFNIKNQTRTVPVPIETALAFVRLMNR